MLVFLQTIAEKRNVHSLGNVRCAFFSFLFSLSLENRIRVSLLREVRGEESWILKGFYPHFHAVNRSQLYHSLYDAQLSLSLSLYLYLSLTINLSSFSLFFISFRSLLHFCLIHFKCLLKDRVYLSLCLYLVPFLSIYLTKSLNLYFYIAASYLLLKAYAVHAYPHLWMYKAYLFCYF